LIDIGERKVKVGKKKEEGKEKGLKFSQPVGGGV
jgi:hypothetical protein